MQGRRAARETVLKSLYAQEYNQERMETLVEETMEQEELPEEFHEFARDLALKTHVHRNELDDFIRAKAEHWEFGRIAVMDKIILRMAICEILYFEDIPPKVSISEAIELSKVYSTDNSGSFINGILDSILQDFQKSGRIFTE